MRTSSERPVWLYGFACFLTGTLVADASTALVVLIGGIVPAIGWLGYLLVEHRLEQRREQQRAAEMKERLRRASRSAYWTTRDQWPY